MSLSAGSLAIAVLFFFGQATSHMIMQHPVPFGVDTLDSSPLANAKPGSAGSDFPCKQRTGVYDISTMNDMTVGTPVMLTFSGSAYHGGGTCQIAVSLDKEPNVESVWKIIQVFEGGCPIPQDSNPNPEAFSFQIPKGFPNGQATLSWTWYNKIGNREVYQNCAPITVTGGSESHDVYDSLPNLYLINLPTSECSTVETTDLEIPSPGQEVVKKSLVIKGATGPSCAASAAAQTAGLLGQQTGSPQDSGSSSKAASATAPAYEGGPSSVLSNYGSYAAPSTLVTIATSLASAPQSSLDADPPVLYPTMTPSAGAGISGPVSASGSGPAAPTSTGSSFGGGNPSGTETSAGDDSVSGGTTPYLNGSADTGAICTPNGAVVCKGSSQFGLCNNGKVVFQAVAAGTTCSNGQIQKRSAKRHAHIRYHAQNSGRYV